jgi:hypothetical protein
MTIPSPERTFRQTESPYLPPQRWEGGVFVLAEPTSPLVDHGHASVAVSGATTSRRLLAHPALASPHEMAALRDTRGVVAVTIHSPTDDDGAARLALAFGEHVATVRRRQGLLLAPPVTAPTPHDTAAVDGLVQLFHFLTVDVAGDVVDRLVWELITPSDAAAWFGGALPDLAPLRRRLDTLLQLRRDIRHGHIPHGPDGQALRQALDGRYFSGRFVLDHYDLIRRLLDTLTEKETRSP